MKKLTTALVLMMTLLPALSGCGRVRYPAYYTLNLPAPPDPPDPPDGPMPPVAPFPPAAESEANEEETRLQLPDR